MFENIKIERFRGIKFADIKDFKQVNLFFGDNNCGKSTLLEALFSLTGQSNPLIPTQLNNIRGYGKVGKEDMNINFYKFDSSKPIVLSSAGKENRKLEITTFESSSKTIDINNINTSSSTSGESFHGFRLKYNLNGKSFNSEIVINDNLAKQSNPKIAVDNRYKETLYAEYIPANYKFSLSLQGLSNIINNKEEHVVVSALQMFDNRVKDFQINVDDIRVDIGWDKRVPINIMGDGTRKLLAIIAAVYSCANGIAFIDEIDNGFHYSKLSPLWLMIDSLAKRVNCQVFATTHSIDSIKSFASITNFVQRQNAYNHLNIDDIIGNSFAAFNLIHTKDDELKALPYTLEQLNYVINQGVEVR